MVTEKYTNPPTATCMYCGAIHYIENYELGDLTHGVCDSPLCLLEMALDASLTKEDFEKNLEWLSRKYGK